MTLTLDYIRKKLGWCPERPAIYVRAPIPPRTSEPPDIAGPLGAGGPQNPGPFRVPGDMLRMLIDPVGTIRRSKNIPMSGILFWFGALIAANSLIFGLIMFHALNIAGFGQDTGLASLVSMNLVIGEIIVIFGLIGITAAIVHGVSRIAGRNSTIPMAVRVVLFGAMPVLLFSWTRGLSSTLCWESRGTKLLSWPFLQIFCFLSGRSSLSESDSGNCLAWLENATRRHVSDH